MNRVKSSLICGMIQFKSEIVKILVQSALNLAENGSFVIFISQKALTEFAIIGESKYSNCPEILERLNFRYFKTREEIINWCHSLHTIRLKPHAIFLCNTEDFISNQFEFFELYSALLDCSSYCSTIHAKNSHLCLSLNEMFNFKFVTLYSLFEKVSCVEEMIR